MCKTGKKSFNPSIFCTLIVIYILMGLTILKKSSNDSSQPLTSDIQEMKTLVGYSLEYKISEDFKEFFNCTAELKEKEEEEENVPGDVAKLFYDENFDGFLMSAFLDRRLEPYMYVRAVALIRPNATLYCQLWHNKTSRNFQARKATISPIWSESWDQNSAIPYIPALLSCPSKEKEQPLKISFQKEPCQEPKLVLKLIRSRIPDKKRQPKTFVICVKPMMFKNQLINSLKDWVLINELLGVQKIVIYHSQIPEKFLSILKLYVNMKIVQLVKFKYDFKIFQGNFSYKDNIWLKRKFEILTYNDCFYRNMENTDFVIPLDLDELIVPKLSINFQDLIANNYENIAGKNRENSLEKLSSISVRNAYFFKSYSKETKMKALNISNIVTNLKNKSIFSRNVRSLKYSPRIDSAKSFIYVPNTLTVFNHFSFHVLKPSLKQVVLPISIAQLNHYRDFCDSNLVENCQSYLENVTIDNSLDRFLKLIK